LHVRLIDYGEFFREDKDIRVQATTFQMRALMDNLTFNGFLIPDRHFTDETYLMWKLLTQNTDADPEVVMMAAMELLGGRCKDPQLEPRWLTSFVLPIFHPLTPERLAAVQTMTAGLETGTRNYALDYARSTRGPLVVRRSRKVMPPCRFD
jgi:hypothetical protein